MKNYLLICLFIGWGILVSGQTSIRSYEYWFNAGFSDKTTETIAPAESFELTIQADASHLPDGLNSLTLRFVDDKGAWSPPLTRFFVKLPEQQISQEPKNIIAWEYQFNNENRIKNEITPGSSFSLDELLDVSSLSDGLNTITLRFRDDFGNWSSPLTRFFVKLPEQQISPDLKNIVAWEYKINNQPAVLSEVTPTSVFLLEEQLNVAELPDGLNTFTVRFKDDWGNWSSPLTRFFVKLPEKQISDTPKDIVAWEYRINNQGGVIQDISPTQTFVLNEQIDVSQLADGLNVFTLRFKDDWGNWSSPLTRFFVKLPEIADSVENNLIKAYEYRIEDATGNMIGENDSTEYTFVTLDSPVSPALIEFEVALNQVPKGDYTVHFRALDIRNHWSSVLSKTVQKEGLPIAGFSVANDVFCTNSPVVFINESIDADSVFWDFGDGNTSVEYEPVHTYADAGDYEVSLFIADTINGLESMFSLIVSVNSSYGTPYGCQSLQTTANNYSETGNFAENIKNELGTEYSMADWTDLLAIADIDDWISCMGLQEGDLFWVTSSNQHYYDGSRHYFVQYYPMGAPSFFAVHAQIENKLFLGSWYGLEIPILTRNTTGLPELPLTRVCTSELPYILGSQSITESGFYTETFQTIHGCDSVVNINLEILPSFDTVAAVSVCDDELPYLFGSESITETGEYIHVFNAINGCDSTVVLHLTVEICSEICTDLQFATGWNIFSIPSEPDSADLKYLFQPLIENGSLLKIQDESGKALEDYGMLGGWNDDIGEISPTEGYKFKAAVDAGIEICGTPVNYPFAIPLTTGWNIMGFPQPAAVDAMDVLQPLINSGTLQKVQNEAGKAIEDYGMLGGWNNDIGNFEPGKGYKIKLAANDTLWIQEAYPKSTTVLPQPVPTTHFTPDFLGNGLDHMNINITGLPANLLQVGDELAVFDGTVCVGTLSLLPHHFAGRVISIPASAKDNDGMPGFTEGNPITLKLWSTLHNREFDLEPEILNGTSTFVRHESTLMSLKNLTITGLENNLATNQPEIVCYPNPFSNEISIEISLSEEAQVQVEIYNQLSQQVKLLANRQTLPAGRHTLVWDGNNAGNQKVSPGIYHVRFATDEIQTFTKIIFAAQ